MTLHFVTMIFTQKCQLLVGLNPFCDHFHVELLRKRYDGCGYRFVIVIRPNFVKKTYLFSTVKPGGFLRHLNLNIPYQNRQWQN